jgi:MazG family protein
LADAVESAQTSRTCEELGDVLFQVLFIAEIYRDQGVFDLEEVIRRITEKMIRRHPHVFGSDRVESTEAIRRRWHEIKQQERSKVPQESLLDSVPVRLPALMRAYRLSERAARSGLDWPDIDGVIQKAEEEWGEFRQALRSADKSEAEIEFGDVLFTLTNVARFARIHPETALAKSVKKFEWRFRALEKRIAARGVSIETLSPAELDRVWEEVKQTELQDG